MSREIRHEAMRIGGEKVTTDNVVEVRYPYTDEVIGTVPAGTAEHARKAFDIAAGCKEQPAMNVANPLPDSRAVREKRTDCPLADLELGICHQHALYETGRSCDVFPSPDSCHLDDGQIFSCDLTPHGKSRKIFTKREPVRTISAITPFNHPLNMVA